jgi:hypothetical protein
MFSAHGWRDEEQLARFENVEAMPRTPWHDEGLTRAEGHSRFGCAVFCERNLEMPFEQIQRFIARRVPFPVVGMKRLIIHGKDGSREPVRRGLCSLVQRNARDALVSAERDQPVAEIERDICLHRIDHRGCLTSAAPG